MKIEGCAVVRGYAEINMAGDSKKVYLPLYDIINIAKLNDGSEIELTDEETRELRIYERNEEEFMDRLMAMRI